MKDVSAIRTKATGQARLAFAGFYAALAIFLSVAAATFASIHGFVDRAERVEHSHAVRIAIERIRAEYGTIRMYWRAFLLNPAADQPDGFVHAESHLLNLLTEAADLTSDNPAQLARVSELRALVEADLAELRSSVDAKRSGSLATSDAIVAELSRRTLQLQPFERVADSLLEEETRLLEKRADETAQIGARTTALIVFGNIIATGLLIGAAIGLRREIRRRRAAQRAAQRAAIEIEDLYNHAPCGYHSLDANGVFVRISDTELSWLGYSRQELLGKTRFADILAPQSAERLEKDFQRLRSTGHLQDLEFDLVRKDGSLLPVSVNATVVTNDAGEFIMSRSSMFDMTQRRKAESERDRFFTLSIDMLCIAGMDGFFRRLNPAFPRTLGYAMAELLERPFLDFVHEDDRAATLEEMERLTQGAPTVHFENRYRHKDGSWRWLSWRVRPYPEEELLYATARDVTDRRQAEDEVIHLNRDLAIRAQQLEETNSQLDSFSYSVSHDLRGPLRAIDGFSRMFEEDYGSGFDDEGRRLLKVIRDNSQKMALLIDDLLAFSRLGRKSIELQRVDMSALVSELLREMELESARDTETVITDLPAAWCDLALIRQVWMNLISNALKFTSERQNPTVEIGSIPEKDGQIAWFVKDNGAGFDMKYYDKLFGVFQRLHSETEFPGTGVGLAIVHRIISRHGGRVWAEGRIDEGATFFFSLPAEVHDDRP